VNTGKPGRNDPCHCDSGKKYKKCCLDKDQLRSGSILPFIATPFKLPPHTSNQRRGIAQANLTKIKKGFTLARQCTYPGCTVRAIGSHTLSKVWLDTMAEKGHLYIYDNKGLNPIDVVREGKGVISKFTGFCSPHDTSLFLSLDTLDVTITASAALAQYYRVLCRAITLKLNQSQIFRDSAKDMFGEHAGFEFQTLPLAQNNDVVPVLSKTKSLIELELGKEAKYFTHFFVKFKTVTPLIGAGILQPQEDLEGNFFNNQILGNLSFMGMSIFPQSYGTLVLFSWANETEWAAIKFIDNLQTIDPARLGALLIRYQLIYNDNLALKISFYDQLAADVKAWMLELFMDAVRMDGNPASSRPHLYAASPHDIHFDLEFMEMGFCKDATAQP
jgi:hypothetical protein